MLKYSSYSSRFSQIFNIQILKIPIQIKSEMLGFRFTSIHNANRNIVENRKGIGKSLKVAKNIDLR